MATSSSYSPRLKAVYLITVLIAASLLPWPPALIALAVLHAALCLSGGATTQDVPRAPRKPSLFCLFMALTLVLFPSETTASRPMTTILGATVYLNGLVEALWMTGRLLCVRPALSRCSRVQQAR